MLKTLKDHREIDDLLFNTYLAKNPTFDFFAILTVLFSFAVKSGFFLPVFLLSWPLLTMLSFIKINN